MRIVHTVGSLRSAHGGPSRSIPQLCAALAEGPNKVVLLTTTTSEVEEPIADGRFSIHYAERPGLLLGMWGRGKFFGVLAGFDGDLFHDHGLWLPNNHVSARVARRAGVPRVVSVRGMLSDWALAQSRLKKRLAWASFQRRDLATASLIHVTSAAERDDVRRRGLRVPVALIPNGVEMPPASHSPLEDGERVALFLSRLHPGKGLLELIVAWGRVRPDGWRLVIAGPDVGGHRADVEARVAAESLLRSVEFVGPVGDEEKWRLFRDADLFVLPSRSENFGMAIAEALAAGVPVVTTHGTPWRELETHRCGWWVPVGVEPLIQALKDATALDAAARRAMGLRGRALVEEKYAWPKIAQRMIAVYAWLLHGGTVPADVEV